MAQVPTGHVGVTELGVVIDSAFDNYPEAQQRASEIFTCVIAAVGKNEDGTRYLRPVESKDPNIFAYAVIRVQ